MKKYSFVLLSIVLMAFTACSEIAGDLVSKNFGNPGSYTELEVENAFNVTVSESATQITVTTGETIMPDVVVEKSGDKLKIYITGSHWGLGTENRVVLPYNPDLRTVDLSGASEFHSEYALEGGKVEIELSGASEFYCDIDADFAEIELSGASDFVGNLLIDEIDMSLSGASNIEGVVDALDFYLEMSGGSDASFEGRTERLVLNLNGASNILRKVVGHYYAFVCDELEGTISGGSNAYLHCLSSIMVSLSGGSELHYTGDASTAGSEISGGSDIIHDVL